MKTAKMERVSFDFDNTLSTIKGKMMAIREINKGNEVWIITARRTDQNADVLKVAKELKIPEKRIVFTNGKDKWTFVQENKIDKHYDNSTEQIKKINQNTKTKGIIF